MYWETETKTSILKRMQFNLFVEMLNDTALWEHLSEKDVLLIFLWNFNDIAGWCGSQRDN